YAEAQKAKTETASKTGVLSAVQGYLRNKKRDSQVQEITPISNGTAGFFTPPKRPAAPRSTTYRAGSTSGSSTLLKRPQLSPVAEGFASESPTLGREYVNDDGNLTY
ncbi:hypothetical protein LTR16_008154, partial [Cryomyces antarcticus]